MSEPGLDYDFLQYIGYDSEKQKLHQRFYLPFFEGCQHVVDLGCGNGDFVELLLDHSIGALGIDADPVAVRAMRERGLPVVNQDVFPYLQGLAADSLDGVFASHLVEHLPYENTFQLIKLAYRALRPGGTIILTTPDPRSLYAHLEMFYLHFGHVTFYHPRLLCFFLEHVGFVDVSYDSSRSPIQADSPIFGLTTLHPIQAKLPVWRKSPFRRVLRALRMAVAYVFLGPYLDLIQYNFRRVSDALRCIDRPFECYARAAKPGLRPGIERNEH